MISEYEARKKAAYGLRFEFGGNLPHLGQVRETDNKYVLSIVISYPRLPETENGDVTYDEPTMIGEIIIDKSTGNMTHTPEDILQKRVGEIKNNGQINYSG